MLLGHCLTLPRYGLNGVGRHILNGFGGEQWLVVIALGKLTPVPIDLFVLLPDEVQQFLTVV